MRLPGAFVALCGRKTPGGWLLLLASSLALLPVALAGAAAAPNIADVEDEVMCPICGTLLELSESPQAERQRVFVARLIADGRSKDEIKDALVAEYGSEVLALPDDSGFDLSAYVVPAVGFAVAALALAVGVGRWRRAGRRSGASADADAPVGEDAERLDADIARYDL